MESLLLASENVGKLKEFQELLGEKFQCLSASDSRLTKTHPLNVVEDGNSYYENSLKKALAFQRAFRVPVLADDSGLEVRPLGGAPGVFSARFGGEISWPERWKLLVEKLQPFPEEAWDAAFRCVLCYYDGDKVPVFFEGSVSGRILPRPKGEKGFGYDPIFFSPALNKTFAEATSAEKHKISHRASACREFSRWFSLQ